MREQVVLAHPHGEHFDRVLQAVQTVNGLQSYYRCKLIEETELLLPEQKIVDAEQLSKEINRKYLGKRVIALTEQYYTSGYIVEEQLPWNILVTCADWEAKDQQPPLRLFLLYSLASALITLEARLSREINQEMAHEPPIGCVFDWWDNSQMLQIGLICARLCRTCHSRLEEHGGLSETAFEATRRILDFVRRALTGDKVTVPRKVWIIHGRSPDWKILREMLVELGVAVEEFNEIQVAGMQISDRWKQMLDETRFAFALMNRDDKDAAGEWLPRMNVVHEIGLCHARIGVESTAILREEGVQLFANIAGINYVQYEPGRLRDIKEDIAALLKERGILTP
jgi:hypothetical protein